MTKSKCVGLQFNQLINFSCFHDPYFAWNCVYLSNIVLKFRYTFSDYYYGLWLWLAQNRDKISILSKFKRIRFWKSSSYPILGRRIFQTCSCNCFVALFIGILIYHLIRDFSVSYRFLRRLINNNICESSRRFDFENLQVAQSCENYFSNSIETYNIFWLWFRSLLWFMTSLLFVFLYLDKTRNLWKFKGV